MMNKLYWTTAGTLAICLTIIVSVMIHQFSAPPVLTTLPEGVHHAR